MALPEPTWSDDDTVPVIRNPSGLISSTWGDDPTKLAVLRAMAPCLARFGNFSGFDIDVVDALAQKSVCFSHPGSGGSELLNSFRSLFTFILSSDPCPDILISGGHLSGPQETQQPVYWCFVWCHVRKRSFII